MNSNVNVHSVIRMKDEQLKKLTNEVKETVATEQKTFAAVDLWQIQRKMKTATTAFKRWNLN